MNPAERLREWLMLDPRPLAEIAAACPLSVDGKPMSVAQLSQIKSGHRANISIGTFARLVVALDRKWAELDEPETER